LTNNDWYGFFRHSTDQQACHLGPDQYDGNFQDGCPSGQWIDGRLKYPSDDSIFLRNWPLWTQNAALTEGEAGYTMDGGFTGDLTLNTSFTAKEWVFAFGHGPHGSRQRDIEDMDGTACPFDCHWSAMHLYTDSYTAAQTITIDANDVNYSGMPTCAMAQRTQPDIGIWTVLNTTNNTVSMSTMNALPFTANPAGIATVAKDYSGTKNYLIGRVGDDYQVGAVRVPGAVLGEQGPDRHRHVRPVRHWCRGAGANRLLRGRGLRGRRR
jgi:hypothetical protein